MYIRNRAVPMKRANVSAKRPKVSESTLRAADDLPPGVAGHVEPGAAGSRGCRAARGPCGSPRRLATGRPSLRASPIRTGVLGAARGVAPVLGQQVVEQVVDGDRADAAGRPRRRPAPRPGCTSPGAGRSPRGWRSAAAARCRCPGRARPSSRAARAAAAGCARRRAADPVGGSSGGRTTYTSAARDGLSSALRTCARASATVASGGRITGSVVIMPPAVRSS